MHLMTRRAFAKLVAVSAGAGTAITEIAKGSAHPGPEDRSSFTIFSFFPVEDGSLTDCKACINHAEYKRFATREAAEANRAHPGCRCQILLTPAPGEEYVHMFGGSGASVDRLVYDLRWSHVPQ